MKLWLSKNGKVPVGEQLSAQIVLGIVSGDFGPGEKLPSTAEIARRFRVHANTVRAVYRDLVKRGWADWRSGSGFYVRRRMAKKSDERMDLDGLVATFVASAREQGHSLLEIQSRVLRWVSLQFPDHILAIEPDEELRAILVAELHQSMDMRVEGAGLDVCSNNEHLLGAFCVALPHRAEELRFSLPPETPLLPLKPRSVAHSVTGQSRPPRDTPVSVISRWPDFLRWTHATLSAVGLDPLAFDLRDARNSGWERGLNSHSFIITDTLTASLLPAGCRPRIFQILSDEAVSELRDRLAL